MNNRISTANMCHEEWLKWRRRGIGGSDAAALVGLSPWASPFTVYADKVGLLPATADNEAMRQGRAFEDYVARRFCEATGKQVRRCNAMLKHAQYPFLLANVDRLVLSEHAGLECKTMNPRSAAATGLEKGDVPPQYYVQCQHYMAVTGRLRWYLAILVLGTGFYWFVIPRDDKDIAALVEAETQFWHNHIAPRVPPAPDGGTACAEALRKLYPQARAGTQVVLTGMEDKLRRLAQLKHEADALAAERQEIENLIRYKMQDAQTGLAQGYHISLKTQSRSTLDAARLRADYPDMDWDKYEKTVTFRRLAVKEET